MFYRLNRVFFVLCLSLCLSFMYAPEPLAQSTNSDLEDAQKMAQWVLELDPLEKRVIDLFDHPNFNFLLNNLAQDTEATSTELENKFSEWETYNDKELADIRTAYEALPPVPYLSNNEDSMSAMSARKDGLKVMINDIETSLNKTEDLFRTAIYEDEIDLESLAIVQVESLQRVLTSESRTIESSLVGTGEDHPQLDLSRQSILTNDFLHAYLQIQIDVLQDTDGLSSRKTQMSDMRKTLKTYKKSLKSGRKKMDSYLRRLKLAKRFASDDTSKSEIDYAVRIIDSYDPSFSVEEKVLENLQKSMSIMNKDLEFGDIEEELEAQMNRFYALIDERLKYDAARQAIIANGQ